MGLDIMWFRKSDGFKNEISSDVNGNDYDCRFSFRRDFLSALYVGDSVTEYRYPIANMVYDDRDPFFRPKQESFPLIRLEIEKMENGNRYVFLGMLEQLEKDEDLYLCLSY